MEETNYTSNGSASKHPLSDIFQTLIGRKKVFYWQIPITFVLSCALILLVPRYYTCDVILAPESQSGSSSGSLQALASTFGFDARNMSNADALYPTLYPDIVSSPNFLVNLFDVPVYTSDGEFSGTYSKYLLTKNKAFFLKRWKGKIMSWISPTPEAPEIGMHNGSSNTSGVDVFCMSKKQWQVIKLMQSNIKCAVDKKTDVITFSITAQDQLVCATLGDSVCSALQTFVTEYRTKKNRTDLAYYKEVMDEAHKEYQEASELFIRYIDSHSSMQLEQHKIEAQNLETEMELKRSAYTSFQKQYLATQARLQENTPVFTVLQSASVPLKPAGPKRMLFVIAMLILVTGITGCVVCKEQLIEMFF